MVIGARSFAGKMLWASLLILGFMAGCSCMLDGAMNGDTVANSSSATLTEEEQELMSLCSDVVSEQPGDLRFVLRYGWEVKCVVKSEDLGGAGDVVTLGYADHYLKTIFLYAPEANVGILAHEAAHALDAVIFKEEARQKVAEQLGARTWDDLETNGEWAAPREMFAEGRAVCLGYGLQDSEYSLMACDQIDQLISETSYATEVIDAVQLSAQ